MDELKQKKNKMNNRRSQRSSDLITWFKSSTIQNNLSKSMNIKLKKDKLEESKETHKSSLIQSKYIDEVFETNEEEIKNMMPNEEDL